MKNLQINVSIDETNFDSCLLDAKDAIKELSAKISTLIDMDSEMKAKQSLIDINGNCFGSITLTID